ncbi:hypothetical protein TWF506_010745 [Arthrobotrys conoides]|uniref:Uncharacterized protein n=1 Tax=Arthrobotrys conoides TaxID=74498 RepID=A0AAN8RW46_9PEZI
MSTYFVNSIYRHISLPRELLQGLEWSKSFRLNSLDLNAHFSFTFNKSLTIIVPLQDLEYSIDGQDKKSRSFLKISKKPAEYILGAPFFRYGSTNLEPISYFLLAAYIFLDHQKKQLKIAPTIRKEGATLVPFAGTEQRILEDIHFKDAPPKRVQPVPHMIGQHLATPMADTVIDTPNSYDSAKADNITTIVIAATIPGSLLLIVLGFIIWLLFRKRQQRSRSQDQVPEIRGSWSDFFNRKHSVLTLGSISDNTLINRSTTGPSGQMSTISFEFGLDSERSSSSSAIMGWI